MFCLFAEEDWLFISLVGSKDSLLDAGPEGERVNVNGPSSLSLSWVCLEHSGSSPETGEPGLDSTSLSDEPSHHMLSSRSDTSDEYSLFSDTVPCFTVLFAVRPGVARALAGDF